MEQFRKIANIILFLLAPLYGQNRYNIPGVYYNMDTTNCIYEERINFDTVASKDRSARVRELRPFRPILRRRLSVPIVVMRDTSVVKAIDSLIATLDDDYTLFPDSSGIFMDVAFYKKKNDSQNIAMEIIPYQNYYMSDILFPIGWEIFFEWYGRYESSVVGCFFYKDILCLVRSYNDSTWSPQCHYYETGESIHLNLFQRELEYWKEFFPPYVRKIYPLCE